jgi:asparagine synthase (glutamine-hydrolysing)
MHQIGHFMTVTASGESKIERWYQPDWFDATRFATLDDQKEKDAIDSTGSRDHLVLSDSSITLDAMSPQLEALTQRIRDSLEKCVISHLMSDAPYGVLLSGGLDSSIIAAIAARHCAKRIEDDEKTTAYWPRLHSFSIGLRGSPDLAAARRAATYLGTVHHEFTYSIRDGIDALSDVIHHQETADVTTTRAGTALFLLARCIRATGVKMVLSGEGSDELFGGYLYFHKCPSTSELQAELVRKLQDLHTFDCLRANKATAAWGVEARVPFLSRPFLDFVMNDLPPAYKLCGRQVSGRIEKWILRRAFVGYLPEDILWRQKEQFSDGVGSGWIDSLKRHAALRVTDDDLKSAATLFPHSTPSTKEGILYRRMYEEHFAGHRDAIGLLPGGPSIACSTAVAISWDASFAAFADCSGRSVKGVHAAAYDDKHRANGAITGECISTVIAAASATTVAAATVAAVVTSVPAPASPLTT